jgi:peptide/nickel transport system substrate-binding protein
VWVGDERGGTVARIDPARNRVADSLELGNRPQGVAVVDGSLWVGVRASGASHRGGILHVVHPGGPAGFAPRVADLDPAQGYNGVEILNLTNDGLVTFRRAGGRHGATPVPDLASELPTPADGGKTYTFHLRPGSRYSTGARVRASDIRRGIARVLLRRTETAAFYAGVRGAASCLHGSAKRCDLSRGIEADDAAGTITFHLIARDSDFINKLAMPNAVAVPAGTPTGPIRRPLAATGPYMVDRFGRVIRLVRNPRFRPVDGRPDGYPDVITIDCCERERASVEAVVRNRSDVLAAGFGVPSGLQASMDELATRYPSRLRATPVATTIYAFLNTGEPPFDNVDARRAVNYAVDRAAFAALKGGARFAQPTCQFLPANFPGYRPYCPYTTNPGRGRTWTGPDLARARRLVARSGTTGMRVTVVGSETFFPEEARLLARMLKRVGYRATAHVYPKEVDYFPYVRDPRHHLQIGLAGWNADFLSAAAYIAPIFGCRAFGPSADEQSNLSRFCDHGLENLMRQARRLPPGDEADALWAQADRRVTDRAAAVPLINPRGVAFLSQRAGNHMFNQQWGTLYDQMWVR